MRVKTRACKKVSHHGSVMILERLVRVFMNSFSYKKTNKKTIKCTKGIDIVALGYFPSCC